MTLSVQPLGPVFGAEILGADLTRAQTPDEVAAIRAAMDRYAVVVIRDADITDADQIRFSRQFGALELPPVLGVGAQRIARELYDVSNLTIDGEISPADATKRKFGKGDQLFHMDSSFNTLPTTWSLLSARIIPPVGGDTEFIDLRAVYEALDDETRDAIQDATAIHSIWFSRRLGGYEVSPEMEAKLPAVEQKMVQTAPDGRPTIVAGAHAGAIVGKSDEEGQALLRRLIAFSKQERFRLVHTWKPHDLLIWDNRCTLHRATPFDDMAYKRDMRRTTLLESGPDRSAQAA